MWIAPDQLLDESDPGDDVEARFLYQHCYAAIHALKMILPQATVAEVICENHEDFLVRFHDGTLVAVQVKTRKSSLPSFKAKDEPVIKALARFARLEHTFPGAFKRFEFVTNHAFWQEAESDNNLPYLLCTLQQRGGVKRLKLTHPLRAWVARICDEAQLNEDQVVAALLKCRVTARNDTVESARKDVVEAIHECPSLSSTPLNKAYALARALIDTIRTASTKSNGTSVLTLYEAGSDFEAVLAHQRLEAKRITKTHIEKVVSEVTKVTVESLGTDKDATYNGLSKKLSVMYEKLARGQLELDRAVQMENLVHAVEALYFRWVNRFGADEANKRLNDLKKVVAFDCTEAKVSAAKNGEPYASEMYSELYGLAKARCAFDSDHVFNCRPEHLMGTAGILTDECTVWWSERFKLAGKFR